MGSIDVIRVAGGLGIFLFSLRFLTRVLQQSMASRFRPLLNRFLAAPWQCFLAGLAATVTVQASSITIVSAMGLLGSSMIGLEQGYFVMLGATVGTTLKAWLFAEKIEFGLVLIAAGGLIPVFFRRPYLREVLEVCIAVGFAFVGLDLLTDGLAALQENPGFVALFDHYDGLSLPSQLLGVLVGCLATMAIQSSSAMIFITLGLATGGSLSFPASAALILGTNIGTTVTGLIAMVEADWNGRRLALAHLLVKAGGVLLTLFFFPTFLAATDLTLSLFTQQPDITVRLAAVHTGFNLGNVLFWSLLSEPFLRFLRAITPDEGGGRPVLPLTIRRMLASSPEHAWLEIDRQVQQLQLVTRRLADYCFGLLTEGTQAAEKSLLSRHFEALEEGLHDLLFRLSHRAPSPAQMEHIQEQLSLIEQHESLYRIALTLRTHLEKGLFIDLYTFPEPLLTGFQDFQNAFNAEWFLLFSPNGLSPEQHRLKEVLAALDRAYFSVLEREKGARQDYLTWLYNTIGHLRRMAGQLEGLQFQRPSATGSGS